ncbi:hypothetical protein [Roseovarius sp. M141]|uniref:hypothetical protein n=1 Tax=Roseovarius sp. M141 TaxID=2583806 RepID=UPI0034E94609
MSKRKGFDIDFPGEDVPAGTPPEDAPAARRGPMASAIAENAEALRTRQQAEAAIRDENDRLAHELVRLKEQGLIVDLIDINAVSTTKLARDRSTTRDPELGELEGVDHRHWPVQPDPGRGGRNWRMAVGAGLPPSDGVPRIARRNRRRALCQHPRRHPCAGRNDRGAVSPDGR